MPPSPNLIALLYLVAAAVGVSAAVAIWRHREMAGARPLAAMLVAAAFWALCDAIELQTGTVAARRLISQVQYLGVVSAAPLFLHAALGLAGRVAPLPWSWIAAIWVVPLLTLGVAWTSAHHDWLWTAISMPPGGHGPGVYEYGWWFWVLTADHYLLSAIGLIVLLRASRRVQRPFRGPLVIVVLAILLPWIGNIIYVFKLGPWPGVNWLALSIIASGVVFAWLTVREGLFDVLPAAREAVLGLLSDGVLVVDSAGAVLLANAAARRLLDLPGHEASVPSWIVEQLAVARTAPDGILSIEHANGRQWLEVTRGDIDDRWGTRVAQLLVVRDVTDRSRVEREREALIVELQMASTRIRTLEGLLPICATCKKIRDDTGQWGEVEAYFETHTGLEFTHGICPECSAEFFRTLSGERGG